MKIVNDILQHIAYSIANNEYVWTDQEKVAIKDNGHIAGEWSDLYTSVNAFLNTNGGSIVIGIKDDEDNNRYIFNGFDSRNEPKLRQLSAEFTDADGNNMDITDYIHYELRPFLSGDVMLLHIDALPDSNKYVYYKGYAYQRSVSGDQKISGQKIGIIATDAAAPANDEPADATTPATNEEQTEQDIAEDKTTFQQSYSAELINIFGTDYISLDPDLKLMLSYIYERNNAADNKYPDADEISNRLWEIKNTNGNKLEQELHKKKIKKTLFLLEKNDMIIRIKAQYRINRDYVVVRNLFN